MLRREHGAAVLIGLNGNVKGLDFPGNPNDLLLVHTDQGPEYRQAGRRVGAGNGVNRLARHLPQAFPGNHIIILFFRKNKENDF